MAEEGEESGCDNETDRLRLAEALRRGYEQVQKEPLPARIEELIQQIREKEKRSEE